MFSFLRNLINPVVFVIPAGTHFLYTDGVRVVGHTAQQTVNVRRREVSGKMMGQYLLGGKFQGVIVSEGHIVRVK